MYSLIHFLALFFILSGCDYYYFFKYFYIIFSKYFNDTDLRNKWSNSLQILGRIQYPHNTDLYYFTKNKSTIDIPLEDISRLMFEVRLSKNFNNATYFRRNYHWHNLEIFSGRGALEMITPNGILFLSVKLNTPLRLKPFNLYIH